MVLYDTQTMTSYRKTKIGDRYPTSQRIQHVWNSAIFSFCFSCKINVLRVFVFFFYIIGMIWWMKFRLCMLCLCIRTNKILHCLVYRPHFVLLLRIYWVKVLCIVPIIPAKTTVTKLEAKRANGSPRRIYESPTLSVKFS